MYKCPYCPCVFATQHDLDAHLQAFGTDPKTHALKVRKAHDDPERNNEFMKV